MREKIDVVAALQTFIESKGFEIKGGYYLPIDNKMKPARSVYLAKGNKRSEIWIHPTFTNQVSSYTKIFLSRATKHYVDKIIKDITPLLEETPEFLAQVEASKKRQEYYILFESLAVEHGIKRRPGYDRTDGLFTEIMSIDASSQLTIKNDLEQMKQDISQTIEDKRKVLAFLEDLKFRVEILQKGDKNV